MDIKQFLEKFVEGYLFHDLENMASLGPLPGCNDGAAGYPMVATTLAGIELIGGLISKSAFSTNPRDGSNYFHNYWNRLMTKENVGYRRLGSVFRNLIRNGLMHTFLAKHGILVTKNHPSLPHLSIDSSKNHIIVDCVAFYRDFKESYSKYVRPIVYEGVSDGITTKQDMQVRLEDMMQIYEEDSNSAFDAYFKGRSTLTLNNTPISSLASGASLPLGPIDPRSSLTASGFVDASSTAAFTNTLLSHEKPGENN